MTPTHTVGPCFKVAQSNAGWAMAQHNVTNTSSVAIRKRPQRLGQVTPTQCHQTLLVAIQERPQRLGQMTPTQCGQRLQINMLLSYVIQEGSRA